MRPPFRRIRILLAVLLFSVFGAVAAGAHTNTHHHSYSNHGIVNDSTLLGHNSVVACENGLFNIDRKTETHNHFEKKNSADSWRFTHYWVALSNTQLGLCS